MPLNPAQLQTEILKLSTTNKPQNAAEAANKIAAAYEQYTLTAVAAGFPLLAPGPGRAGMASGLIGAFSTLPGAPPLVAQGFFAMVNLYWLGATFAAVPFPGIVAAPPAGASALIPTLSGLLANPLNPAELYAAQLALALDAATRTVLVTLPQPPPAPPLIVPVV